MYVFLGRIRLKDALQRLMNEYGCMSCGYSETFIEEDGLETIREHGAKPN